MALNNLERLIKHEAVLSIASRLLENQAAGLNALLQIVSVSQFFADTLVLYPESIVQVLQPPRAVPTLHELNHELRSRVDETFDDVGVLGSFRRFRHLQMLRIGINDILLDRPLEEVTRDLSRVADASLNVALQTALRMATRKFGQPTGHDGRVAKVTGLAFGKLGGEELNYSSDIDLMFVYDQDGKTEGGKAGRISNSDFFARVISELVRLLSSHTEHGFAYRVDLRLRPEGGRGPLARSLPATLSYYDVMGRTWERQALIKLRHVSGDEGLGLEFVNAIQPFVYRKYFSFSEINEVKALKRRMEQRVGRSGIDDSDVKTGRGGIRDIEYTVQFLQLLNGGDLPAVHQRNTLLALEALEIAGCLTPKETYILADGYRFLRKVEHRLQLLFDWQTHKLPTDAESLRTLAKRLGYRHAPLQKAADKERTPTGEADQSQLSPQRRSPLDESDAGPVLNTRQLLVDPLDYFLKDYHDKTELNRAILDHLLHQTFADGEGQAEPEADLILDPDPDESTIEAVIGRYPFRDVRAAYRNLTRLSNESVRFLSHRRCRHFLASIAPQLLRAIANTSDPDQTLNNLERVTASLGAKAVLYELFSFNPASLQLTVEICSSSPYLISILTNNPGMIDELLDSLVLDRERTYDELLTELVELCRGATELDPILHSFQDKELLRIGVRDLLGKDDVRLLGKELSDLADVILTVTFQRVEAELRDKFGTPAVGADQVPHKVCRYAVIGLGKLGGSEISYHSDLDLILLYEADGTTTGAGGRSQPVSCHRYFTELMQRAIRVLSHQGPLGRLYEVDMRLRPTGKSGSLVLPLSELTRYFSEGSGQVWERMSLTRARIIHGYSTFADQVGQALRGAVLSMPWKAETANDILTMRHKLEATAPPRSLKRGRGGLVDVEFVVQLLQLKYSATRPELLVPNIWEALAVAAAAGLLQADEHQKLVEGYAFLRAVEARLRLITDRPLTSLPDSAGERGKLAMDLGIASSAEQDAAVELDRLLGEHCQKVRHVFETVFRREA